MRLRSRLGWCSFSGQSCRSGMICFSGASDPNMHKQDATTGLVTFHLREAQGPTRAHSYEMASIPSSHSKAISSYIQVRHSCRHSTHDDVCLSIWPHQECGMCGAGPVLTYSIHRSMLTVKNAHFTVPRILVAITLRICLPLH